jgi:hypothetical protein
VPASRLPYLAQWIARLPPAWSPSPKTMFLWALARRQSNAAFGCGDDSSWSQVLCRSHQWLQSVGEGVTGVCPLVLYISLSTSYIPTYQLSYHIQKVGLYRCTTLCRMSKYYLSIHPLSTYTYTPVYNEFSVRCKGRISTTTINMTDIVSHPVTNPLPRTHASRMFDISPLVTPHVDKDTLYPTSCRTHVL